MRNWIVAMLALAACGGSTPEPDAEESKAVIRVSGSETINRSLMKALTDTYVQQTGKASFEIKGGGSSQGMRDLVDEKVEVASASRGATPTEEKQATEYGYTLQGEARTLFGVDVITIKVHEDNPISDLSYDQLIGIFCKRNVDNWSYVGGSDQPIRAVVRDPRSGTRAIFEDFFCGPKGIHPRLEVLSSDEIEQALERDPNVVTFGSLTQAAGKNLALRPDPTLPPIEPKARNVIRGRYPLHHDLYLFTRGAPQGPTKDFINWVMSPAGQEVVDEQRFVPIFLRPEVFDEPRPLRETIHFEADSSRPNQRSMARLQLLESELKERKEGYHHIILEGFADAREKNGVALSEERAKAVQQLLEAELKGMYFEVIPRGASRFIAPNDTPYGRQQNRRVQIYLADEEQQPDAANVVAGEEKPKEP